MATSDDDSAEADDLERWTRAAAAGDRAAIDALLERYTGELHAFVRLRVGPGLRAKESTMDLVQSVCREILEHSERFQHSGEAAFKRWLYVTALRKIQHRHEYYTAEKRDRREEALPLDEHGSAGLLEHYRRFSTPSRAAILKDEVERVERTFAELSEAEREVVTLAHLVGLSRAEIAEEMGRSEGAVRVLLHRALVKIAALLDEGGGRSS